MQRPRWSAVTAQYTGAYTTLALNDSRLWTWSLDDRQSVVDDNAEHCVTGNSLKVHSGQWKLSRTPGAWKTISFDVEV